MYIYNKGRIHRYEIRRFGKAVRFKKGLESCYNCRCIGSVFTVRSYHTYQVLEFLSLTCQNQDFHRYVNSAAQTSVNNQNNSASVEKLLYFC